MHTDKFKKWLQDRGCEILPITNQYEAIRWKGKETGVIYTSGRTSGSYATNARKCYKQGLKWDGGPISTGRKTNYKKQKKKLIERDGSCCFYCGLELGEDITLEHLQSLSSGGSNSLGNMVLSHEKCNQEAGNKTIVEKVKIALYKRQGIAEKKVWQTFTGCF